MALDPLAGCGIGRHQREKPNPQGEEENVEHGFAFPTMNTGTVYRAGAQRGHVRGGPAA